MTFPAPYRARPARRDDLDALVALLEARDLADVGYVDQAREEILEDWGLPSVDLERDTVVIEAPDAALVGYGIVLAIDPSTQIRGIGRVHPAHVGQGLGSSLLAELERRASLRVPLGTVSPFRLDVAEQDRAAAAIFLAAGYRHVRSSWLMHVALPVEAVPSGRTLPEATSLRTGTIDDEPRIHEVVEESFRDHFGYEPFAFDAWRDWIHAAPGYDPGLSVLAWSDDRLVGAAVNFGSDESIGWVGDLGVLTAWRGRGIGRALLERSFDVLAASGHHEARLAVDTENESGATHLYRSAGMSVRRRFDLYERQLAGA